MNVNVMVADERHLPYAENVCHELYLSSLGARIGIAQRTPDYIRDKILAGKAVIALTDDGEFAGFSYIESWGGKSFVANSGLIVPEKFRSLGIAKRIKEQTFLLSRKLFPDAKIFSMTTSAAVMKMNYEFGFRPVTYDDLTDDVDFWKGCEGCRNFQVLQEQKNRVCICTGLLYDPKEHLEIHQPKEKKKVVVAFSGGLDTSYAVSYLANEMDYEVHAVCANTGGFSAEQLKTNEENAYKLGAARFAVIDITQEYYAKSLKYMIYGNVLRNGTYPISVSSERLFQAMAVARYAKQTGGDRPRLYGRGQRPGALRHGVPGDVPRRGDHHADPRRQSFAAAGGGLPQRPRFPRRFCQAEILLQRGPLGHLDLRRRNPRLEAGSARCRLPEAGGKRGDGTAGDRL